MAAAQQNDSPVYLRSEEAVWRQEKVLPDLAFHRLPVSNRKRLEWMERNISSASHGQSCTHLAVVFEDINDSINFSKECLKPYLQSGANAAVEAWVYLNTHDQTMRKDTMQSLQLVHPEPEQRLPSIQTFSDFTGQCSKDQVANDLIERAGMMVHHTYTTDNNKPSPEDLWFGTYSPPKSEWHRESSRLCGAHAWVKLKILERKRGKAFDAEFAPDQCNLTDSEIEVLAQVEHRRWCAVHLLRGWRPLLTLKDEQNAWSEQDRIDGRKWYQLSGWKGKFQGLKQHLCLMPFARLESMNSIDPERGTRELMKDHEIVKATLKIIKFATTRAASNDPRSNILPQQRQR